VNLKKPRHIMKWQEEPGLYKVFPNFSRRLVHPLVISGALSQAATVPCAPGGSPARVQQIARKRAPTAHMPRFRSPLAGDNDDAYHGLPSTGTQGCRNDTKTRSGLPWAPE